MMEKAALFIAVVTALAFCAVSGNPVKGPQKCCLPKQWSSNMTDLGTVNNAKITMLALQMDFDRKQQVFLNYTGSFETPESKILIDFEKNMMYVVLAMDPEKCYKIPLELPLIECIPDNAEYMGSTYLGSLADGKLPYDGWRMNFTTSGITTIATLAMTQKGCVPLVEGVSHPQNPNQNKLYMFSGFVPSLTDPSAFNLPESCN